MKALSYYDDIKKRVIATHDNVETGLNDIAGKLKRKNKYLDYFKFNLQHVLSFIIYI